MIRSERRRDVGEKVFLSISVDFLILKGSEINQNKK